MRRREVWGWVFRPPLFCCWGEGTLGDVHYTRNQKENTWPPKKAGRVHTGREIPPNMGIMLGIWRLKIYDQIQPCKEPWIIIPSSYPDC